MAGAAVCDALVRCAPTRRVALFEATSRVGGRLLSLRLPGAEGVPAELGAMRFRSSQPHVSALVAELGLVTRPFRTVHDDNRFVLRGGRWAAREAERAASVYALADALVGLSPAGVLFAAVERVVPDAADLTAADWEVVERTACWRSRPLRDWSLGELLADVLGPEAHRYVRDGFGYATLLAARGAAAALPWLLIEARPEEENTTLTEGMDGLPRALVDRFVAAGGTLLLRSRLVELRRDGDGPFTLAFDDGRTASAASVVLALPRRPLDEVARRSSVLSEPALARRLTAVTPHAAAKLFTTYERAWWRDDGPALRAVTDLPLSKVYYLDRSGPAGHEGAPLLLASYSDGAARAHWAGLAPARDRSARARADRSDWRTWTASEEQLRRVQEDLQSLHPRVHVPEPLCGAFTDWTDGAWHLWNPGEVAHDVVRQVVQPFPATPLFVCGEAYALSQGWVEGALETAHAVVDRLVA